MLFPCVLFVNKIGGSSARSIGAMPAGSVKGGADMIRGTMSIYMQTLGESSTFVMQHPPCSSSTRK